LTSLEYDPRLNPPKITLGADDKDEQKMDRLSHEQFIPDSQFRIYHQNLHEDVESHWHEFFELGFIMDGDGEHVYNGTSYPLTRGSLFLLTPTDIHALYLKPGTTLHLFNVIFSEAMMQEQVGRLLFRGLEDHHVRFEDDDYFAIENDFRRLWAEVQDQRVGNQLAIHSTLQRLLIDVARSIPPSNVPKTEPMAQQQKLQKALIYLHHHYREQITLQLIADQVALSPNYFSECFRSATGVTFQRYLQSLRLRFAKSLLSVSALPITDVCYAAGFQTLSHFERAFKREFGRSPTAWRSVVATHNHNHAGNGSN
jgi:AraC-like DNA-binding protein